MDSPTSQDISSRFERATRSALASSSFTLPPSPSPPAPSLSDLLSQHAPPDSLRCSHCHAPLLRGPRSLFCFACGAPSPFHISSLPKISFRSSLAHRRLLDSLQIEGLEGKSEEPGDESAVLDLDASNYHNLGPTQEQESVRQKILPSSFLHPQMKSMSKIFDSGQYLVPTSASLDTAVSISGRSAEATVPVNEHSTKQDSIVDYSAKLDGISLEDFFSNQIKSEGTISVNASAAMENLPGSVEDLNVQNEHKDPFWDTSIDFIISDGDRTTSRESEVSKENLWSSKKHGEPKTDNLEDDESWEDDFQSAAPAAEMTTAECFTSEQFNAPVMQPGYYNDLFVSSEMKRGTYSDSDAKRGVPDVAESASNENSGSIMEDDNEMLVLHDYVGRPGPVMAFSSDRLQETDTERQLDLDDLFFGSSWQQNVTAPSVKDGIEEFLDRTSVGESFINSATHRKGEDFPQPSLANHHDLASFVEFQATTLDNGSIHHGGEPSLKTPDDGFAKEHQTKSQEKANELLGSLLAQLHDLSFMLADKLVIKTGNVGNLKHRLDLREPKLLF